MKKTLKSIQAKYGIISEQGTMDMTFPEIYKKKYPNYAKMTDNQLRQSLKSSAQKRMNKLIQAGHSVSGGTSSGNATYKFNDTTYELSYDSNKYYPNKWINKGDKNKDMIQYMQFIAKVNVMDNM